ARSAGGRGEHRIRAALAITQLALAAALIGAGAMLTRSLVNLDAIALGFQPRHVLTFQVQIPPTANGLGRPDLVPRLAALHSALAQVPGITAATIASDVPFEGEQLGPGSVYPYPFDGRHTPVVDRVIADSGYFETLDIPLLAGQPFGPRDTASRAPSAVVDVQAARALFGTTEVVGREFSVNDPNDARPGLLFRIVGIIAHARKGDLDGHDSEGAPACGSQPDRRPEPQGLVVGGAKLVCRSSHAAGSRRRSCQPFERRSAVPCRAYRSMT